MPTLSPSFTFPSAHFLSCTYVIVHHAWGMCGCVVLTLNNCPRPFHHYHSQTIQQSTHLSTLTWPSHLRCHAVVDPHLFLSLSLSLPTPTLIWLMSLYKPQHNNSLWWMYWKSVLESYRMIWKEQWKMTCAIMKRCGESLIINDSMLIFLGEKTSMKVNQIWFEFWDEITTMKYHHQTTISWNTLLITFPSFCFLSPISFWLIWERNDNEKEGSVSLVNLGSPDHLF